MGLTNRAINESISVQRASTAMCWNSSGIYAAVAANAIRLDHDPVTRQPVGILCEETRTNLARQSANLSSAPWISGSALTITTDTQKAPDGTPMQLVTLQGETSHHITQALTGALVWGARYTISLYCIAKKGLFPIQLGYYNGGVSVSGGVVTPTAIGKLQLISYTFDCPSTPVEDPRIRLIGVSNGLDGDQVYLWGMQLEQGGNPSSRIPTLGSQATRAGDITNVISTAPWLAEKQGSVVITCLAANDDPKKFQPMFCTYSNEENYALCLFDLGKNARYEIVSNAGPKTSAISVVVLPSKKTIATRRSETSASICADGGAINTTPLSAGRNPSVDKMKLGSPSSGSVLCLNGHIIRVRYFQRLLTDAEMKGMTL